MTVMLSGIGGDEVFAGYPRYLAWHLAETAERLPNSVLGGARAGVIAPLARPGGGGRLRGPRRNLWKFMPRRRHGRRSSATSRSRPTTPRPSCATCCPSASSACSADTTRPQRTVAYLDHASGGDALRAPALPRREDVPPVPQPDLHGQDVDGCVGRGARAAARRRARRAHEPAPVLAQGAAPDAQVRVQEEPGARAAAQHHLAAEGRVRDAGPVVARARPDAAGRRVPERRTSCARRGLFSPAAVARMRAENTAGEADYSLRLYALLNLELWHQAFVDRRWSFDDAPRSGELAPAVAG